MKTVVRVTVIAGLLLAAFAAHGQEWLERADQCLRFSLFNGVATGQISGLLDLEGYYVQQPAVGLLRESDDFLFAPRLTLALDAQITPAVYVSTLVRVDRGFDPADRNVQARFDEYAITWRPIHSVPIAFEAGKFASVVGTYAERYESWTNPFINAPLPYENVTAIWDQYAVGEPRDLQYWRYDIEDRYLGVPVIWGPSYASGFAALGQLGTLSLAAEVKNASLSSRPETWDFSSHFLEHPTWSGHIAWQPSPTWRFGSSGSIGSYLRPGVTSDLDGGPPLPSGKNINDYNEITVAEDATFAWRHWQLWAEVFETRFQVPNTGNADTLAYYIEAKYKFTPQFFGALRWNQQLFATVPIAPGQNDKWGNDIWRIDAAVTYRWTENIQTKLQYSFTDQTLPGANQEHLVAGQLTVSF